MSRKILRIKTVIAGLRSKMGTDSNRTRCVAEGRLKTFPEQIRQFNKKSAAISSKTRLEIPRKWIEPIAVKIVVITNVERSARVWCVAKQKLTLNIRG